MPDTTASHYRRSFARAVKTLRERSGLTQAQVAVAIGVDVARYKQWEVRSPIPAEFIERYCIVVRTDPSALFALAGRLARGDRAAPGGDRKERPEQQPETGPDPQAPANAPATVTAANTQGDAGRRPLRRRA